ncbi:hypothetical protein C0Q70_06340 [Pomacea canaliculata]|uniref:Beta-lactamase-related domain-containing protein n=1 Tax=Pomacea canaliculata TaxID=400727 RepID=A0A2T7PNQ9_POMCA|nr:uncharacterized protein LOC112559761 [Pomacea canaliculata]XP_025086935.1 uncharacterized protein LOC112559761 [Pomacea canaliculata]PVD35059.1 hypothetical protein C0Q70_06340 [Pomacea canaliculata]
MSTVLILLCLCSLALRTAADVNVLTPELTSKIEAYVKEFMQCRGVVGLSLAVVKGNETWTRGFGMADKPSERPVNSSTLFIIASVTKAFTSTLLGMLMDESKSGYTWKTPIKDILGSDFQLFNDYITNHTTVKDILTHRTGLTDASLPMYAGFIPEMSRQNFTRLLKYLPALKAFRDEYNYNNWMYALAGRIAEVMGGSSWEELLKQRIFHPLQMNDSRIVGYNVDVDADNFALPYVWLRNEVVVSDKVIYRSAPAEPSIAIASSADDMAKWLSFHLQKGVTMEGEPLLVKETLEETYKLQIALPPGYWDTDYMNKPEYPEAFSSFGYGFAWDLSTYRGYRVTSHAGAYHSYKSYLALFRDVDIGIFITTTALPEPISLALDEIFFYIADLLLGEDPWLNTTTSHQYIGSCIGASDQTSSNTINETEVVPGLVENPEMFEGTYGHRLFGDIVIYRNTSGELLVKYGNVLGRLRKTSDGEVLLAELYGPFEFLSYTLYVGMTFLSPNDDGQYKFLVVSFSGDPLLYQRGISVFDLL